MLGLTLLLFRVFGFVVAWPSALHIYYIIQAWNEAKTGPVPSDASYRQVGGAAAR